MPSKIDLDRGVMYRTHPGNGMNVFMYIDEPGIYRSAFGTVIDETLALEAGFETEKYGKDKVRRERMATAMGLIDKELQNEANVKDEVVREKDGFKIIDIGLGRHVVKDPDGNVLTTTYLPKEQAEILLDQLVPDKEKESA